MEYVTPGEEAVLHGVTDNSLFCFYNGTCVRQHADGCVCVVVC